MFNLTPATQEEHDSLVEKCQKNGWLKRGGFDWQDDPWLEEYPYDFSRASTIKDLADFFSNGNWAIRQGVLFGDLAFIQQVNGGDEWWTLKRCPDGSWLAFESYTMSYILPDMSRFTRAIASMQLATPEECKRLEYSLPKTSLVWDGGLPRRFERLRQGTRREFRARSRCKPNRARRLDDGPGGPARRPRFRELRHIDRAAKSSGREGRPV